MKIKIANMEFINIELEGNANEITVLNYNGVPILSDLTNNKKIELK